MLVILYRLGKVGIAPLVPALIKNVILFTSKSRDQKRLEELSCVSGFPADIVQPIIEKKVNIKSNCKLADLLSPSSVTAAEHRQESKEAVTECKRKFEEVMKDDGNDVTNFLSSGKSFSQYHRNRRPGFYESKQGILSPFQNLKKANLVKELKARNIETTDKDRKQLQEDLTQLLHGISRPPALMIPEPHLPNESINIQSYEMLCTKPLHDLTNVIQNIITELPYHIQDKEAQKEFQNFYQTIIGDKNQVKGFDVRLYLVELAKFAANLHEQKQIDKNTIQMIESLVEITYICYSKYECGSAKQVLRLYNQCFYLPLLAGLLLEFRLTLKQHYSGIDGLPLFKSTRTSLWLILCGMYFESYSVQVFPVALCLGHSKPDNLNFLDDFIEELNRLEQHGFFFKEKNIKVKICAFIYDAPAKAMIKGIKFYSGYFGCDRCTQTGVWNGRIIYQEIDDIELRTDINFRNQAQTEHHHRITPLTQLLIDMIKSFPIDYMHQACLGVMKRLLLLWLREKRDFKISANHKDEISRNLIQLREVYS
ncbi:unnamed protein product [Mytilus coruscus]|uniref:Uncharacterized protein n=1 Tax=Mytilus coruscus TaxID=42192 RepID=A0A6J8EZJ0_MYTCO|nr:unnamed protein product [Mytilus coruscus]